MSHPTHFRLPPRNAQSGAVLYVALIMLILLALIGVIGMQVAGLQERMSANYMAVANAFEAAEGDARTREISIKQSLEAGTLPETNLLPNDCETPFNPATWSDATDTHTRRVDECFAWASLDEGFPEQERTDQIYQITAFERDAANTASAVINTTFIP